MMQFLSEVEDWFVKPARDDLSPMFLIIMAVILTIVVMWTMDGVNIIKEGIAP